MPTKRKTPVRRKKSNLGSVKNEDRLSVGGAILSFVFPVVGVYHFAANHTDKPKKASTALALAAVGLVGNLFAYAKMNERASKKFVDDVTNVGSLSKFRQKEEKYFVKSKDKVSILDGSYVGEVSGWTLTILSQPYYNTKIGLEFGIKGMHIPTNVVVKNGIAYCCK
ncbi:hypothetical protein ACE193_15170 [Bernardetia sp. OM2101]|uniref:hypothetical protein n=1 Tax=Bernardetia sp. OM2101 TaxID=3344876 RepID=UPI0035D129B6